MREEGKDLGKWVGINEQRADLPRANHHEADFVYKEEEGHAAAGTAFG